jgi:NADPH:quinone reductase-like Zn-dependent oxidoreductase
MVDTMKAWAWKSFGTLDGLVLERRPIPSPGPGEALVRVRANSLNQRDLMVGRGALPSVAMKAGLIPLSDGAGEVVAVGDGVSSLHVGDRVVGIFRQRWQSGPVVPADTVSDLGGGAQGMLAEYVCLSANGLVRFPDHLSFAEAATLPCAGVTAWSALFVKGALRPGETMLALGTGGVSIFAIQLAVAAGARALVTTSSAERGERARTLGAAEWVNYRDSPAWHEAVLELTGGHGADLVVENGGAATYLNSLQAAAISGRVALVGLMTGMADPGGSFATIFRRDLTVRPVQNGSRLDLEALMRMVEVTQLRPVIDRSFAFSAAPDAYRRLESGAAFGKVVIEHD